MVDKKFLRAELAESLCRKAANDLALLKPGSPPYIMLVEGRDRIGHCPKCVINHPRERRSNDFTWVDRLKQNLFVLRLKNHGWTDFR
jgi:hypothetical protein